jgi:hypothetical protein
MLQEPDTEDDLRFESLDSIVLDLSNLARAGLPPHLLVWKNNCLIEYIMKRLDQGHLHPKLEIPLLTCPGQESNPAEHCRKKPFAQLVISYSEHVHMSLRHGFLLWYTYSALSCFLQYCNFIFLWSLSAQPQCTELSNSTFPRTFCSNWVPYGMAYTYRYSSPVELIAFKKVQVTFCVRPFI